MTLTASLLLDLVLLVILVLFSSRASGGALS